MKLREMSGKFTVEQPFRNHQGPIGPRYLTRTIEGDENLDVDGTLAILINVDPGTERFMLCAMNHHAELVRVLRRVKKFTACMGEEVADDVAGVLRKVDRDT